MNRRTSNYTAHFDTPAGAEKFAANLSTLDVPVQDHGHTGITFRAADDESAAEVAFAASSAGLLDYSLSTGLGVHRRDVQP